MKLPRARKDLGQHWLTDSQAVDDVIAAAELTKEDTVIEVGPGPGILTPKLATDAGNVIAVELDENVLPTLRSAIGGASNVEIRQADVLGIDPAAYPRPYHVVGNVPYYITSAIIRHFLETSHRPQSMTLTIQKEVAERIAATPPRMSVLAISVQLYGSPRIVRVVPRTSFTPPPAVDSAILRIEGIGEGLAETLGGLSETKFFTVVRAGFAEKRKQLHNSLAHNLQLSHDESVNVLEKAEIKPNRRAETLTITDWVRLGHVIHDQ